MIINTLIKLSIKMSHDQIINVSVQVKCGDHNHEGDCTIKLNYSLKTRNHKNI